MNASNPAELDFADELNVLKHLLSGDTDIETQISEQCFQRIENEKILQSVKDEMETVGFTIFYVLLMHS